VLGFSMGIPLDALRRYFVVMWVGFWVNAFSGVLLLLAYPTKALTNPLFYTKLALIAFGVALAFRIRREVDRFGGTEAPPLARTLAAASLACWIAVIFAGRLLAYTCTRLTVDFPC
jgi:hypothetical protein